LGRIEEEDAMMKIRITILTLLACGVMLAGDCRADETALFTTTTAPDGLILLDLSGSMAWNPAGDDLTYGSTDSCYADTTNCSGTGCSGGFCGSSKSAVTFYAAAACATPDTINCVGSNCSNGFCSSSKGATTVYAAASCGTPSIANCRGASCGRTDGFCNNSVASGVTYYAHSSCSTPDTDNCRYSENWSDCRDGFCATSHHSNSRSCQVACTTTGCTTPCTTGSCSVQCTSGGCTKNCSRLAIAKRSIFNILDDNNDNTINASDETSLGVRLGYMRFTGCSANDSGTDYTGGCSRLDKTIGSSYSSINTSVQAETASGGTPLISALKEAKSYLDVHKAADDAKDCRQKFVILITDGSDTYGCSADGSECDNERYKNRREAVAKAKALRDAGYKVFVIGFGTAMPPYLRNTLNWMAYYGGTDDPNITNSGSTTAYSIVTGCDAATNPSACCSETNLTACYPSGVTSCGSASSVTDTCYDATKPYPTTTGISTTNFRASSNDPGYLDLTGYAFIAANADELVAAVKAAINIIREATYSFSQSSIQSSRTADENYIYEGSFQPVSGDPFWRGHLRRFSINSADGTVATSYDWDAGVMLASRVASDRIMKTYKGGVLQDFTTANITPADLGITDPTLTDAQKNAQRDAVVGYIRGENTSPSNYNPDSWKLGDVFRSTPITVGEPSPYFSDVRDANNAFKDYGAAHPRKTSPYSGRVVIAGANDGQLHAFKTNDGSEAWSFIPPNLLPRLKLISHATEPTSLTHTYYVDGPVTVADAWLPSYWTNGKSKSPAEWRTLMVFAEGRGAGTNLWSSSSSCDSGFNQAYTSAYPYYCGYYALDITNEYQPPVFKWRLGISSAQAYMGSPWSKMMVGRILDGGLEKWVGFVGGGANAPGAADSGKGFFVVDLASGNVLWSFTKANDATLNYPMPAPPSIVDSDNDGFIDTAYLGDLGGNMWRFTFCLKKDGDSCGTSSWTAARLFQASSGSPIYTSAAVTKDWDWNVWVYWGTGDKLDPTNAATSDKIFAVKDSGTTRTIGSLQSLSGGAGMSDTSTPGYYLSLATGEKVLANPAAFGGVLYVTTFTPSSSTNPCYQGGTARLYGLDYATGAKALVKEGETAPVTSMEIGTGIPSAPIISVRPDGNTDLYVTTSGSGLTGAQTQRAGTDPPGLQNRTNLLFWKDKRVEP
jgi:Tfp pilus tip-associated adhesin PilY1